MPKNFTTFIGSFSGHFVSHPSSIFFSSQQCRLRQPNEVLESSEWDLVCEAGARWLRVFTGSRWVDSYLSQLPVDPESEEVDNPVQETTSHCPRAIARRFEASLATKMKNHFDFWTQNAQEEAAALAHKCAAYRMGYVWAHLSSGISETAARPCQYKKRCLYGQ